jgi:hypothetical protein
MIEQMDHEMDLLDLVGQDLVDVVGVGLDHVRTNQEDEIRRKSDKIQNRM